MIPFNRWAALALAGAALAPIGLPARAQEAPGGDQPIVLRFKNQPGSVQRFKAGVAMDLSVTIGDGGLGALPIASKMTYVYSEKVAGVKDNAATLAVKIESIASDTNVMGNSVQFRVANGKLSMTANGQPVNPEQLGPRAERLKQLTSTEAVMLRRSPQGDIAILQGNPTGPGQLLGAASPVLVRFPDNPIRVGDSWEVEQTLQPSLPAPGVGNVPAGEFQFKFTHTLKSLDRVNGRQVAVIESAGVGTVPEGAAAGPLKDVQQNLVGTTRFDLGRGAVLSGSYTMDMAMRVDMPGAPGGPGQGAPAAPPAPPRVEGQPVPPDPSGPQPAAPMGSFKMSGQIQVDLAEVPAAVVKPTRAPAKKAPVRGKGPRRK